MVATTEQFGHEEILRWMRRFDASVVVVRPDRYVLASAYSLDHITEQVVGFFRPIVSASKDEQSPQHS